MDWRRSSDKVIVENIADQKIYDPINAFVML